MAVTIQAMGASSIQRTVAHLALLPRCGRYAIALLLLLMTSSTLAQPTAREETHAATSQLQTWVHELSAREFATRDAAMRQLIDIGPAAIQPVEEALAGAGLEVTTRGIYILQEIAKFGDTTTEDDARRILEKFASQRTTVAARHASESLAMLDVLRQEKSLKELALLGARIDRRYEEPGILSPGTKLFLVEIGSNWKGATEDLSLLKWLRDVEQVTFSGRQVTDEWIPYLRGMRRLFILKLSSARISDEGFAHFKELPAQRILLQYVPVGDTGAKHLADCRRIDYVRAFGTRITDAGQKVMEQRGIAVDRRNGAFLGITVNNNPLGRDWSIGGVTKGSAAAGAGLQVGDVIVRYGDKPVDTFKSLIDMIRQNNVGDTVVLQVRRNSEILEKTITFGEWQ